MLSLTETDVTDILSAATSTIRRRKPDDYRRTKRFQLEGSKGTPAHLSVTTQVTRGEISFSVYNGGPSCLGTVRMPIESFPGTAGSFLSKIVIADPDAPPPARQIQSAGFPTGRCHSSNDGV